MIEKLWHKLFICIIIITGLSVIHFTYHKSLQQNEQQRDVSKGTLSVRDRRKNGIMVLCYHRITKYNFSNNSVKALTNNSQIHEYSVSQDKFEYQVKYLKKHHVRFISADQMVALVKKGKPLQHQYVVITFDDFDQTVYDNGLPFLKKNKIPFTVFTVTGTTGDYNGGTKLVSWSQIRKMSSNPLVTVGLHTNNLHYLVHNKSAVTTPGKFKRFKKDYKQSQKIMVKNLGKPSSFFAYPYGDGNQQTQQYLVKNGIVTFSLNIGIITEKSDLTNSLPRVMVDDKTWEKVVRLWLK
ncbi:polysaccharide deacetylase family protein [Limosilactobacillus gorillae]|uniref:polysaccharide deacetylase family protein n=1 Tax=Limosilactobacillus gorillae TaxID=1450649 RepID=UPI000A9E8BAC|nr:polysaccharide deacetylase family protein [Limosilactobacillus gorillae]